MAAVLKTAKLLANHSALFSIIIGVITLIWTKASESLETS